MILDLIRSIDWGKFVVLYSIIHHQCDIDELMNLCSDHEILIWMIRTRCLLSMLCSGHILNHQDLWTQLSTIDIDNYQMLSISLCSKQNVSHTFILVQYQGQWYILQSYALHYSMIIEPIDVEQFIKDIADINDPDIWYKYFHVEEYGYTIDIIESFGKKSMILGEIPDALVNMINDIDTMIEDNNSYIHDNKYSFILKYI